MEEQLTEQSPEAAISEPKPKKKQVHPAILVVGLLIALAYVGWQYTVYFGMPKFGRKQPVGEVVMDMVRRTGGDITKVSKIDMGQLNDITMGNGEKYYKIYAVQYAKQKHSH